MNNVVSMLAKRVERLFGKAAIFVNETDINEITSKPIPNKQLNHFYSHLLLNIKEYVTSEIICQTVEVVNGKFTIRLRLINGRHVLIESYGDGNYIGSPTLDIKASYFSNKLRNFYAASPKDIRVILHLPNLYTLTKHLEGVVETLTIHDSTNNNVEIHLGETNGIYIRFSLISKEAFEG